jgi:hypothetical protein
VVQQVKLKRSCWLCASDVMPSPWKLAALGRVGMNKTT